MALDRDLALWMVRSRFAAGPESLSPLFGAGASWLGAAFDVAASRWTDHLQARLDEAEPPSEVLAVLPSIASCEAVPLQVVVPRRSGWREELSIELPALLVRATDGRFLACLPAAQAAWPGPTAEAALEGLRQRMILELATREDLDGDDVLGLCAVTEVSAIDTTARLRLPTFAEIREARRARSRLLPVLTRAVRPSAAPCAFGVARDLEAMERAFAQDRSVLLIGPAGSGKSARLRELARGRSLREIDAPGLLLGLLGRGFDWQEPFVRLVAELAEDRTWLAVGHLTEWFEVGRYAGNDTSLAEMLRTPVARRDVRLLAEATPEEVARLEARWPGHLDAWQRVVVTEGEGTAAIGRAWVAHHAPDTVGDDAVDEIVRLHQRFAPYSGQPGRAIRALEALAAAGGGGRTEVVRRFCEESGLPEALVDPRAPLPVDELEAFYAARLYGQPDAVRALVDALAAAKADVARWGRPLASLLFVGPTGVGKTEAARATAERLFGSASRLVRFDMSEVATPLAVSRLVDGPDGEGRLTHAIRRQPFSVVLFDEVEKAHPAFLDLLLQILGEGRLTDGRGRTSDWSSAVVLLTSNVGSAEAARGSVGLTRDPAAARGRYVEAVSRWLRPELRNRLDRVVVFDPLPRDAVGRVLDRELAALRRRPGLQGRELRAGDDARDRLIELGHHPRWGARELLRVLHHEVAVPTARALDGWREPRPPRVEVRPDGAELTVELTPGERAARDDTGDLDHAAARELRRQLGEVALGGVVAELSGAAQAEERHRQGRRPTGLSTQLRGLETLRDEARALERRAGRAALRGESEPSLGDALAELRARGLSAAAALLAAARPETSRCVVGVYGAEPAAAPVRALAEAAAEALGVSAKAQRVFLRVAPERDAAFWVEGTSGPRPALGVCPGWEVLLEGDAASLLGQELVALWALPDLPAAPRVRTVSSPGDRKAWERVRPADPHRRSFFTGAVQRHWSEKGRDLRGRVPVGDAADWLAFAREGFATALFRELS